MEGQDAWINRKMNSATAAITLFTTAEGIGIHLGPVIHNDLHYLTVDMDWILSKMSRKYKWVEIHSYKSHYSLMSTHVLRYSINWCRLDNNSSYQQLKANPVKLKMIAAKWWMFNLVTWESWHSGWQFYRQKLNLNFAIDHNGLIAKYTTSRRTVYTKKKRPGCSRDWLIERKGRLRKITQQWPKRSRESREPLHPLLSSAAIW